MKHFRPFGEAVDISGVFAVSNKEDPKSQTDRLGETYGGYAFLATPSAEPALTLCHTGSILLLANDRNALLAVWSLPLDRPYFRLSVALDALAGENDNSGIPGRCLYNHMIAAFFAAVATCRQPLIGPTDFCPHLPGRLRNPHTSIKYKPLDGGQIELVKGDYDYYHYMQDKMDDNVRGLEIHLRGAERCRSADLLTLFHLLPWLVLGLRLQVTADDLQLVQAAGLHNGARAVPSRDPGGVSRIVERRMMMLQCSMTRDPILPPSCCCLTTGAGTRGRQARELCGLAHLDWLSGALPRPRRSVQGLL